MSWRTPILLIAVSIAAACATPATSARAIELRSTNQMPDLVDQNADKVAIWNIGSTALNISYLEGDWKSVQIPPGQYVTIPCQSTGLSVSFNDGVETKSLVLNRSTTYAFYWSAGLNRWTIAPYDEVGRRPSRPTSPPAPARSAPLPSPAPSQLAQSLGEKLRELPANYNRPDTLLLGSSTPVELVIQTADRQAIEELLKGFAGEVRVTTVRMASSASAYLTGPKDMVEITLRGDPFRSVTADAPVSWIWDVRPLKPGQVQVVMEVFSHVKIGADEGRAQIRVLQDTWNIEAKGLEWVKYQIADIEPIRVFLFTLISSVVAALAYFGIKSWQTAKP